VTELVSSADLAKNTSPVRIFEETHDVHWDETAQPKHGYRHPIPEAHC
jgi:hypothetical protein